MIRTKEDAKIFIDSMEGKEFRAYNHITTEGVLMREYEGHYLLENDSKCLRFSNKETAINFAYENRKAINMEVQ